MNWVLGIGDWVLVEEFSQSLITNCQYLISDSDFDSFAG